MEYKLLEKINSPEDLKAMGDEKMPELADEIRRFLIDISNKRGGHLASNLGVVELTLAIHKVFDSPRDHIIFDVGHQSYVHKLLTGRRDAFDDLRSPGGLSGFTLRRESPHDPFGAGHSSTSVSAALGFAEADELKGEPAYTVCVLGDGSYTGGMVHEALNNCKPDLPLVIILNENGMSISPNKGTFAAYFSRVRTSKNYLKLKKGTNTVLSKIPLVGKPFHKVITGVKNIIKSFVYSTNYFEELGLYYMGPIDGNDYEKTKEALKLAKDLGKTVVVHLKTVKGRGYDKAENCPEEYHSVAGAESPDTYHSVFAEELITLAEEDSRIVAVTAAMGIGTGLDRFGEKFPNRYYDVGIAEPHALTFSAAFAADGLVPFIALYSTFLQRGYDSIVHDIALQGLPVKIMIDRATLSVGDGATHHGIFDVSLLSAIPGIRIFAPSGYDTLRAAMRCALTTNSPVAIRYPNASENKELNVSFKHISGAFSPLVDFDINDPPKYIFITYGALASRVVSARELLKNEGISAGVIIAEEIKPNTLLCDLVVSLCGKTEKILYAEEGIKQGGAAESFLLSLMEAGFNFADTKYAVSAVDDNFASPDSLCDLYDYVGLSPEKLAKRILNL